MVVLAVISSMATLKISVKCNWKSTLRCIRHNNQTCQIAPLHVPWQQWAFLGCMTWHQLPRTNWEEFHFSALSSTGLKRWSTNRSQVRSSYETKPNCIAAVSSDDLCTAIQPWSNLSLELLIIMVMCQIKTVLFYNRFTCYKHPSCSVQLYYSYKVQRWTTNTPTGRLGQNHLLRFKLFWSTVCSNLCYSNTYWYK